jgi:hypothetical protein
LQYVFQPVQNFLDVLDPDPSPYSDGANPLFICQQQFLLRFFV